MQLPGKWRRFFEIWKLVAQQTSLIVSHVAQHPDSSIRHSYHQRAEPTTVLLGVVLFPPRSDLPPFPTHCILLSENSLRCQKSFWELYVLVDFRCSSREA